LCSAVSCCSAGIVGGNRCWPHSVLSAGAAEGQTLQHARHLPHIPADSGVPAPAHFRDETTERAPTKPYDCSLEALFHRLPTCLASSSRFCLVCVPPPLPSSRYTVLRCCALCSTDNHIKNRWNCTLKKKHGDIMAQLRQECGPDGIVSIAAIHNVLVSQVCVCVCGGVVFSNSKNDQTKPKTQNQRARRRGIYSLFLAIIFSLVHPVVVGILGLATRCE
jgi:hypothetical protein